ncbi:MAG: methylated-DNA--[protein]-cysteine S-methyltransferase [Flavobacteriales bacterium]
MTPEELANGGKQLSINYSFSESLLGDILIASTSKGLCHAAFIYNQEEALTELKSFFPNATFTLFFDALQQSALQLFSSQAAELTLHLKATPFQLKVWEELLKIPSGKLSTYGDIAKKLLQPTASRAVGTAIGDNPIAYIIPCHRVVQASGKYSGYRWGLPKKAELIRLEAAQTGLFF